METTTSEFRISPQQKLALLSAGNPGAPVIGKSECAAEIEGDLDLRRFREALLFVHARYAILRTKLSHVQGEKFPVQTIQEKIALNFSAVDLPGAEPLDAERYVKSWFRMERDRCDSLNADIFPVFCLVKSGIRNHRFLVSAPFTCLDDGGLRRLIEEIFLQYESPSNFATGYEEPVQYADVSEWLNQIVESPASEAGKRYWQSKKSVPIEMPKMVQTGEPIVPRYSSHILDVCEENLFVAMRTLGDLCSCTLPVVISATWHFFLARLSGMQPVCVKTLFDGREDPELRNIPGLLARYLPICSEVKGEMTFNELLYQHEHEWRDSSFWQECYTGTPSAESEGSARIYFEFRNYPFDSRSGGLSIRFTYQASWGYPFDIRLIAEQREERLSLRIEYDENAVTARGIVFLVERYTVLLTNVLGDPGMMLRRIPILGPRERREVLEHFSKGEVVLGSGQASGPASEAQAEGAPKSKAPICRQRILTTMPDDSERCTAETARLEKTEPEEILHKWNRMGVEYGTDACIHELFEKQVVSNPDATAVIYEDKKLTYGDLNQRANQVAHHLRNRHGVGPEVLVGICMERSIEMMVGLLGILKAGGAYLPLDPEYPTERLSYMLKDAGISLVLTQARLASRLQTTPVLCLDVDIHDGTCLSKENPLATAKPDNLAYVIYTSGSTGWPKGALNTHGGICNRLLWMQDAYGLQRNDCILQKTTFGFDVSVWEFFWPLIAGASLALAKAGGQRDSRYLIETIIEKQITHLHFVPSMLGAFLQEPDVSRCSSLKHVMCSGEALPVDLATHFFTALSDTQLHNLYGPTEAAIDVTFWRCSPDRRGASVPIGRPIANMQVYVLDEAMEPVPLGISGEIYIGGVGLARGYLNRPSLTAERFVPNPYGDTHGKLLYRTGDLARWQEDGVLEFLGRSDDQMKIRGHRIEPGEIEAAIREEAGVRDVVVVAQENQTGQKRLVAYVVGQQDGSIPTWDELQNHLRRRLPEYMVPALWVRLEALPLMLNGKLDRQVLPAPPSDRDGLALPGVFQQPRNEYEYLLVDIWKQLLDRDQISVDDNFFRLGGHSLLVTQLAARLQIVFGVTIPLMQLIENPTISAQSLLLTELDSSPANYRSSLLTPIRDSSSQESVIFIHPTGGGISAYCNIAQSLAYPISIYAVRAPNRLHDEGGRLSPTSTLVEVATSYVAEVRATKPHGPYILGGWSHGGLLAFEMAQQLVRAGELVSAVLLIDTHIPTEDLPRYTDLEIAETLAFELGAQAGLHLEFDLTELERDLQLSHILKVCQQHRLVPASLCVKDLKRALADFRIRQRMEVEYRPERYDGRVILFHAKMPSELHLPFPPGKFDLTEWKTICGDGLQVVEIMATHNNIVLFPQVDSLGRELDRIMDQLGRQPQ